MVAECFGSRKHMPAPNFIFMFKTYIMFLLTMNIDEPQQVKSKHRLQPELHRVFVPSLFLFVDMSLDNEKIAACNSLHPIAFISSLCCQARREARRITQRRTEARKGARRLRRAEARRGAQSHTEARRVTQRREARKGAQRRAGVRRGVQRPAEA